MFRAYHPSDDRPYIVKVLRIDATPEQARLLVESLEQSAAAGSFHPAVAMPLAVGVEGGTPFLVQEYIAAAALDAATRSETAAESRQTLELLDRLAEALDAAHGHGLLHGALHPRDIFVEDGSPRVTGFAVVPALETVGLRGPLRRPYSAPERVAGESWGAAADRFAFAAVAYEYLTGRRPTGAGAQADIGLPALEGEPDSEAVRAAFAAALAVDPDERPPSARRIVANLRSALGLRAALPAGSPDAAADQAPAERVAAGVLGFADAGKPGGGSPTAMVDPLPDAYEKAGGGMAETPEDEVAALDARPPRGTLVDEVAPARRAGWPWWWPVAMASVAGLLIVAAAASYVAGLRLGSNMAASSADTESASMISFAAAEPEANPAPPPAVAPPPALPPATPAAAAAPAEAETSAAAGTAAAEPALAAGGVAVTSAPVAASEAAAAPDTPSGAAPVANAGAGWVLVRTMPPGASVTIAGQDRGSTPLSIGDLEFGSHSVLVHRDGFEPATREVALSSSDPVAAVGITLAPLAAAAAPAPAADVGSVAIESRPPGARVIVDGRRAGTTPAVVRDLASGSHQVRIELEGYLPWVAAINVQAGNQARVTASLDPGGAR